MARCFLKLLLLSCLVLAFTEAKKGKSSEVVHISDIKDWKKELRTKKNVLALFTKDSKKSTKLIGLLDKVSVAMRGLATLVLVDCGDAAKLCKKLKISPKVHLLNHYSNGDFNKVYDRKETESSMVLFLRDPTGEIPWEEDAAAKDVLHLDFQGFKRLLRKTELPILTMFYAPWCGHCKQMKPEFNQAATATKGRALLVGIDADGGKGAGPNQEYNVTSFPTILYFEKGTFKFKFTGKRTKDGIIDWLESPSEEEAIPAEAEKSWAEEDGSPVEHLDTDNFKPFMETHDSVLVMFYAPWCGHCKAMKPELVKSAIKMEETGVKGKLAAVDVTLNKALGEQFGIKGYPTVIYFKEGNRSFEHPGIRKEKDILSFMMDPKEPPPPAPEAAAWSEEESAVVHMSGGDFEKAVKRKKHALVMFYAPWCGHCKMAKPKFTAAAEELASNNKVMLGAVDCTIDNNRPVCSKYGVKGFPTMVYLGYGESAHRYSGAREQAAFVEVMSSANPSSQMSPLSDAEEGKTESGWGGKSVTQLEDLNSFLGSSTPALVAFYTAGCTTCNAVQTAFSSAASSLESSSVVFGAYSCTSETEWCSGAEPKLVLFKTSSIHVAYKHSPTSSRDMRNFILEHFKDEL